MSTDKDELLSEMGNLDSLSRFAILNNDRQSYLQHSSYRQDCWSITSNGGSDAILMCGTSSQGLDSPSLSPSSSPLRDRRSDYSEKVKWSSGKQGGVDCHGISGNKKCYILNPLAAPDKVSVGNLGGSVRGQRSFATTAATEANMLTSRVATPSPPSPTGSHSNKVPSEDLQREVIRRPYLGGLSRTKKISDDEYSVNLDDYGSQRPLHQVPFFFQEGKIRADNGEVRLGDSNSQKNTVHQPVDSKIKQLQYSLGFSHLCKMSLRTLGQAFENIKWFSVLQSMIQRERLLFNETLKKRDSDFVSIQERLRLVSDESHDREYIAKRLDSELQSAHMNVQQVRKELESSQVRLRMLSKKDSLRNLIQIFQRRWSVVFQKLKNTDLRVPSGSIPVDDVMGMCSQAAALANLSSIVRSANKRVAQTFFRTVGVRSQPCVPPLPLATFRSETSTANCSRSQSFARSSDVPRSARKEEDCPRHTPLAGADCRVSFANQKCEPCQDTAWTFREGKKSPGSEIRTATVGTAMTNVVVAPGRRVGKIAEVRERSPVFGFEGDLYDSSTLHASDGDALCQKLVRSKKFSEGGLRFGRDPESTLPKDALFLKIDALCDDWERPQRQQGSLWDESATATDYGYQSQKIDDKFSNTPDESSAGVLLLEAAKGDSDLFELLQTVVSPDGTVDEIALAQLDSDALEKLEVALRASSLE